MTKFGIACMCTVAVVLMVGLVAGLGAKATARPADGGGISGKVYFHGAAPSLRPIVMDKDTVCASEQSGTILAEDGRVNANGTLPNAFVYISKGTGNLSIPAPPNSVTLTQKGCVYEPHVLGIMVGQPLQVVTIDPTAHNIHVSATKGNRDWNVTQQPGTPSVTRRFTEAAIMVPVHCNIHPWMEAFIGVVTNPYFAVTGDDGSFTIKGVPPGDYTLTVWTATFGTQEHSVTVRAGESAAADFTFSGK
jgi:plastocyanin